MFYLKNYLNNVFNIKNILFLVILVCNLVVATMPVQAQEIPADFDHDDANFLLSGAHLEIACDVCHVRNVYQGIPLTCEECHSTSSMIAKTKKSNKHFESENTCDNCHTVETWAGARIDHASVVGTCIDCHNDIVTTGKPSDHISSVDECHECHTTRQWKQSGFDHIVITGNCFSCHNGSTAKGKSKKHRLSNNQCDDCHHVKNWKHKKFDHRDTKLTCVSCHQNQLPALPHPKNNKCNKCHIREKKWQQIRFKHEKTNEFCINCHKNRKPANHFIISASESDIRCDDCHRAVSSWITNLRFDHDVIDFHEHRINTPCTVCHLSNSRNVIWRYATYKPKCAGCHASNFRSASHSKAPGINYNVNELAHCSGSCHLFTDATFTVRASSRNRNANYHTTIRGRGIGKP